MLIKKEIAAPYNLDYHLVGDLDWVINALKKSKKVRDTGVYMCRFVEGGISTQHRKASLKQRFHIMKKHFGLFSTLWQHFVITINAMKRGSLN